MSKQKDNLTLNVGIDKFKQAVLFKRLTYPCSDYWAARLSYDGFKTITLKDNNKRFEETTYTCLGIEKDFNNGKWNFIIKLS